ncbi:MAG: hypothetical protein QOJ70_2658 [Acidobacteriota bacterium]|jgi:osmotically-inducible protein OsmY|nr:hypothetical protein [Acidobacteriota bacterium]
MNINRAAILIILGAGLALSACGGAVDKTSSDNSTAPNTTINVNTAASSSTTGGGANANAVNANAVATNTMAGGAASPQQPGASQSSASHGASNTAPTKVPTPQIGSGGNDFFLFTKVHAAFNNDPELKTANVVIDVKDGVVTLSGTVANAALKSKAEELARGTGTKSIKNQLRVAGN